MFIPVLLILVGLLLLVAGGELLVRGASTLARLARIDPLLIGLTVVALGTSAPEMAVCLYAALSGQPELALGNVVGSNIANVLLILGLSAIAAPLVVGTRLVRLDVPVMIVASAALLLVGWDGVITQTDGLILFSGLMAYLGWLFFQSRAKNDSVATSEDLLDKTTTWGQIGVQLLYVAVSIVLLVFGSNLLVQGASEIARQIGVSDLVIGLTVVAVGTSLPELAACLMAVLRGNRDLAVGNCVGSNILNILAVMGLTGIIAPDGVRVPMTALQSDIPIMIVVAFACLPVFATGNRISRWEGFVFFGYFIVYIVWLFVVQTDAPSKDIYAFTILVFVLPLTVITFALIAFRRIRANRSRSDLTEEPGEETN